MTKDEMNLYELFVTNPYHGFAFDKGSDSSLTLAVHGEHTNMTFTQWIELADAFHKLSEDMKKYAYTRAGDIK
ncbi:MAG TPA: hypothetical protein VGJ00_10440 [Rhabdochlamydiaceae bacterium]|jgi:hypothetical protein